MGRLRVDTIANHQGIEVKHQETKGGSDRLGFKSERTSDAGKPLCRGVLRNADRIALDAATDNRAAVIPLLRSYATSRSCASPPPAPEACGFAR